MFALRRQAVSSVGCRQTLVRRWFSVSSSSLNRVGSNFRQVLAPQHKAFAFSRAMFSSKNSPNVNDIDELPSCKETTANLKKILKREINEEDEEMDLAKDNIEELMENEILQIFKLSEAKTGNSKHELTRTFGDENITVSFDVNDAEVVDNQNEENQEQDNAPAEEASDEVPKGDVSVSYNFTVVIKRADKATLSFDAVCSGNQGSFGQFDIMSLKVIGDDASYAGPDFGELAGDLQEKFYEYLAQRGVDEKLAAFVASYAELRESQLYREWLDTVLGAVGAGPSKK